MTSRDRFVFGTWLAVSAAAFPLVLWRHLTGYWPVAAGLTAGCLGQCLGDALWQTWEWRKARRKVKS